MMTFKEFKECSGEVFDKFSNLFEEIESLKTILGKERYRALSDKACALFKAYCIEHREFYNFYTPLTAKLLDEIRVELKGDEVIQLAKAVEDILKDGNTEYIPKSSLSERWFSILKDKISKRKKIFSEVYRDE